MRWQLDEPVTSFDLFAGVGGFRRAADRFFTRLGVDHTSAGWSEIDKFCRQIYGANFDIENEPFVEDIRSVTLLDGEDALHAESGRTDERIEQIDAALPDFNILFAGFPCQSFSLMGNQKGLRDPRGTLFFDIREILRSKAPEFCVLENVRGLMNLDGGETFETILATLDNLGYQTTHWMLNSADYGVPQIRRRVFIVGVREDLPPLPEPERPPHEWDEERYVATHVRPLLEREVDDCYWLSDRLLKTVLSNGTGGFSYKSEIDQEIARPLCRTMHKMHRAHQDNYYSERYIHAWENGKRGRVRRLTPREAFLLQGFEERFVTRARDADVSDTRLYMGAGNAVTVTTAEAVLERLFLE